MAMLLVYFFVIIAGDNKFCSVSNFKVETLPVLTFRFIFLVIDWVFLAWLRSLTWFHYSAA